MYFRILLSFVMSVVIVSPCFGQLNNTQRGAFTGGTAGAIIGGIIGNQNDETSEGVLIGGGLGVLAGGLLGKQQDQFEVQRYQYQQQRAQQQAVQFANGVSVNDVIAMSQSGVDCSVIANQIQSSGIQQRIGVDEIIALHQNGVDRDVINVMQQAHLAGVSQPISPAISPAIAVEPDFSFGTVYEHPRSVVVPRPVVVHPRPIVVTRPAPYRPRPSHGHYRQASPRVDIRYRR